MCNFTNALFFWAIQPETAKRPLEEMNVSQSRLTSHPPPFSALTHSQYLFTNAPIFIPTMNMAEFSNYDLENRVADVERKASVSSHVEENKL